MFQQLVFVEHPDCTKEALCAFDPKLVKAQILSKGPILALP